MNITYDEALDVWAEVAPAAENRAKEFALWTLGRYLEGARGLAEIPDGVRDPLMALDRLLAETTKLRIAVAKAGREREESEASE